MLLPTIIAAAIFALGFIAGRMDRDINRVRPLSADDISAMLKPDDPAALRRGGAL